MHKEIDKIRDKLVTDPWPKFLKSVTISGLRGWTGQTVRFTFPVCVLAGENGSGKSTLLKAAAAAYAQPSDVRRSFYPSTFFPDTPWETVTAAILEYKVQEGTSERDYVIRKPSERWRIPESRPRRHVIYQDVSRTLPLEATVGYARIAKRAATETATSSLAANVRAYYSSIMGRTYDEARIATTDLDDKRGVGVVKVAGKQFSQFHQGAGEDATFDLLALLQNVPATSLVLVDEIEASLHPRAQRRLVHFLLWLARTKHLQVIVSTHSSCVMEELPAEARIFLSRGSDIVHVMYAPTPEYALTRMDDYVRPDLYIFVEDNESAALAQWIVRAEQVDTTRLRFMAVGPHNVVNALAIAARSGAIPLKAVGVLDADTEPKGNCLALPGNSSPERDVFEGICEGGTQELADTLQVTESRVRTVLNDTMPTLDHHEWTGEAARKLGVEEAYLWESMCAIWARKCAEPSERRKFVEQIVQAMQS